ncbi:MAG: hypothetical protein AB8B71_16270 [Paracoccaceae bacterium]
MADWKKKATQGLLFTTSAQTVMQPAADLKRLDAWVVMTSMHHTSGLTPTHLRGGSRRLGAESNEKSA